MSATATTLNTQGIRTVSSLRWLGVDDPFLFRRARTWLTLTAICLLADGNGFLSMQDKTYYHKSVAAEYASDPMLRLLTIAMWAICIGLMVRHIAPTLRTMLKQRPLLAVAAFAVVSTLWSPAPPITFKKALFLSLTFAFGFFFATYYSLADQRRMLLTAGAILGIVSVIWIILLPTYGVATSGEVAGEWKGVFGQKNDFGIAMCVLFSSLPFCHIPNLRRLFVVTLQAIFPILLIAKAYSRESLIVFALFVGIRCLGPILVRTRREKLPFIIYVTAIGFLGIVLEWHLVLSLFGQGAVSSWSGRLREWSPAVPYIFKHLWLGYGYGGFWTGEGDSLSVMRALRVPMHGIDSGYVENMLELGLVGMSLLLVVVLRSVRDFVKLLRRPAVPLIAFWYVSFILLTWVLAVVGTTFPLPSASTFIYVVACCGLERLVSRAAPSSKTYG